MTTIDLQPFCALAHLVPIGRDYLTRPIHIGPWTFASNGHIGIRIDRLPGSQETLAAPVGVSAIFEGHQFEDLGELPLFTHPAGEVECHSCKGSGVVVDDDYGNATTYDCETCNGYGKEPLLHVTSVEINETILAARYFEMIRALPFPKLSYGYWPGPYVPGQDQHQHPLHFSFEGGIGRLMPMRQPHKNHVVLMRPGATR